MFSFILGFICGACIALFTMYTVIISLDNIAMKGD